MIARIFLIILLMLPAFGPGQTEQQLVDSYVQTWSGLNRARWATFRYDPPGGVFEAGGYISDAPREWRRNLNPSDPLANAPVDPFNYGGGGAKHVLIMVHGYGAPANAYYYDIDAPFFTSTHAPNFHETGTTAWFDNGQSTQPHLDLKLYSYLRRRPGGDEFNPNEWVILATTMNILPHIGGGLSIVENSDRLRALVDLLWELKGPQIKTISFVSHSTGSPITKAVLGRRTPASAQTAYLAAHPWIAFVDDHINLAGALGGTPSVLTDGVAMQRPIGQQLLYGIHHPLDYQFTGDCYLAHNPSPCTIVYRYTGGLSMADGTFKRSYRWPAHINVLSVAGVWDDESFNPATLLPNNEQPFDGNPFSFKSGTGPGGLAAIPNEVFPAPSPFISALIGKSDGIVPNRSVIEHIQYNFYPYAPGFPLFHENTWVHQTSSANRFDLDWSSQWRLVKESSTDGGGAISGSTNALNIPVADRFPGDKVTYVEINAAHNGMLHSEHLMRVIRRRLGTFTVTPNVQDHVWVDFAYNGPQNGTFNQPYNSIGNAVPAVQAGGRITFKAGSSPATFALFKNLTLEAYGGEVHLGVQP